MELRAHKREKTELAITLVQRGRVVASTQAFNMSTDGICIRNSGVDLIKGQKLGVVLSKPGYPRGVSCCIRAKVIHSDPQSAGLKFDENESC